MNDLISIIKLSQKKTMNQIISIRAQEKGLSIFLWFDLIWSTDIHDILFHTKLKLTIHTFFLLFFPLFLSLLCESTKDYY